MIDDFSIHIRPGEKIGLVGRSGAGKSTIVSLLLRFYDVERGRVLIDGQNIADVAQDSLRAQVGMVTQDTSLLHRSVRDNILYGRPDADDTQMVAAARRAEAHEFIQGLTDPAGRHAYDAHVGERGVKLSGGQRQRVAIARVMLKDAPILILDEATSALDSEVEIAIQESLYRLMEGKTVVAIAHRLSTIAALDRLIVMDKGRIVEEGDHATLLARGGLYARLWAHQSGGFLGETDEDEAVPLHDRRGACDAARLIARRSRRSAPGWCSGAARLRHRRRRRRRTRSARSTRRAVAVVGRRPGRSRRCARTRGSTRSRLGCQAAKNSRMRCPPNATPPRAAPRSASCVRRAPMRCTSC